MLNLYCVTLNIFFVNKSDVYRVGLKGLQGFEISRFSAAKGGKPAPIHLSAIFGKIDKKSRNHVQAF